MRLLTRWMMAAALMVLMVPAQGISGAKEALVIEGIMHDAESPEESMVMVSGELLNTGDVFNGYTIKEIHPAEVVVEEMATGKTEVLDLPTVKKPEEVAAEAEEAEAYKKLPWHEKILKKMSQKKKGETAPAEGAEKEKGGIGGFNPAALLNRGAETAVLAEMKKISGAANVYLVQEDNQKAKPGLQDLVDAKLLSKEYAGGEKGKYAFRMEISAEGSPVIYASPIDKEKSLRHFCLDGDGVVYSEADKPATIYSPKHQAS